MQMLLYLIPISIFLGTLGLIFFLFTLKTNQYEDLEGNAQRILIDDYDDKPRQVDE